MRPVREVAAQDAALGEVSDESIREWATRWGLGNYPAIHYRAALRSLPQLAGTPEEACHSDRTPTPRVALTNGLRFPCGCIVTHERVVKSCGNHAPTDRAPPDGALRERLLLLAADIEQAGGPMHPRTIAADIRAALADTPKEERQ